MTVQSRPGTGQRLSQITWPRTFLSLPGVFQLAANVLEPSRCFFDWPQRRAGCRQMPHPSPTFVQCNTLLSLPEPHPMPCLLALAMASEHIAKQFLATDQFEFFNLLEESYPDSTLLCMSCMLYLTYVIPEALTRIMPASVDLLIFPVLHFTRLFLDGSSEYRTLLPPSRKEPSMMVTYFYFILSIRFPMHRAPLTCHGF